MAINQDTVSDASRAIAFADDVRALYYQAQAMQEKIEARRGRAVCHRRRHDRRPRDALRAAGGHSDQRRGHRAGGRAAAPVDHHHDHAGGGLRRLYQSGRLSPCTTRSPRATRSLSPRRDRRTPLPAADGPARRSHHAARAELAEFEQARTDAQIGFERQDYAYAAVIGGAGSFDRATGRPA